MDPRPRPLDPLPAPAAVPAPLASAELFLAVYEDLRRLAQHEMRLQGAGHTLQPTALVNEAYVRLGDGRWQNREHFLRVAARAMRQILVDHGRRRSAEKRLPRERQVDLGDLLDGYVVDFESRAVDLVLLDRALTRLEEVDPQLAELVELHFFGGQAMAECARYFGVSERQVFRWWKTARAFLHREVER